MKNEYDEHEHLLHELFFKILSFIGLLLAGISLDSLILEIISMLMIIRSIFIWKDLNAVDFRTGLHENESSLKEENSFILKNKDELNQVKDSDFYKRKKRRRRLRR
jgi:hypothetical protein